MVVEIPSSSSEGQEIQIEISLDIENTDVMMSDGEDIDSDKDAKVLDLYQKEFESSIKKSMTKILKKKKRFQNQKKVIREQLRAKRAEYVKKAKELDTEKVTKTEDVIHQDDVLQLDVSGVTQGFKVSRRLLTSIKNTLLEAAFNS